MAIKATYVPGTYADGKEFFNGIPARSLTDAEWAALTPASDSVAIDISEPDPEPIRVTFATLTPHNLVTGDYVTIVGHTGSDPDLNGPYRVTVGPGDSYIFSVGTIEMVASGGSGGTVTKYSEQGMLAASSIYTIAP